MTSDAKTDNKKPENGPAGARFKTDNLQSSYANFCNANSTKEEVVLNFGINSAWDRNEAGGVEIDLRHRIVLSPFAAKRLSDLLQKLVGEYEGRYGSLK